MSGSGRLSRFMAASAKVIAEAVDDEGVDRADEKCSCGVCDGVWTRGEKERHYGECPILVLRELVADGESQEVVEVRAQIAEAEMGSLTDQCTKEIDEIMRDAKSRIEAVVLRHLKLYKDRPTR